MGDSGLSAKELGAEVRTQGVGVREQVADDSALSLQILADALGRSDVEGEDAEGSQILLKVATDVACANRFQHLRLARVAVKRVELGGVEVDVDCGGAAPMRV